MMADPKNYPGNGVPRTTLITGANRGLGLEFARQYAADGWRILACSRDPGQADALVKLAAQYPEQVSLHALDVSQPAQIDQLARSLQNESIDLLLNNAGVLPDSDKRGFGHTDYDSWIETMRINTMAPLKMAEAFAAHIIRSRQKAIVTITSKMGSISDNSSGGYYLYRSSKAAVNIVMKSLAVDLQPKGVIAVVLHPGWVQTDMGGANAQITPQQSVSGMRKVISNLTPQDSGKFFAYDGSGIDW
jgi:NAD(P)-dependent dehydrogenase (short-subunit alcohol dehydrogenase family)